MKKLILVIVPLLLVSLIPPGMVHAATNYNRIIDDVIFDNTVTMSASQIDSFLNTLPASCISPKNGFSAPNPIGYSPTTQYQYGSDVTAGTIISSAAQAYGINPQVLLTTLEKEQGLVKGAGGNVIRPAGDTTDCGALAFSASVGYNCPDSQVMTPYSGFELYAHAGVGTLTLSGSTVTGTNTTWTSAMVGNNIVLPDGKSVTVSGFTSSTSLAVSNPNSYVESSQSYRTQIMSVQPTCVQRASYVGFSRQVIIAAWQFSFDRHRAEGLNNWAVVKTNWDNSDDLSFCYSHDTVAGGPFYLCPDRVGHTNDPYVSHSGQYVIDSTVVTIYNGATAALLNYTPHTHGQDLFTSIFNNWFGPTLYSFGKTPSAYTPYATSKCTISNYSPIYVGRLYNPDTQDYLYTPNQNEACNAVTGGYIWDGIVFKSALATDSQAIPIYRISNYRTHKFLADKTIRDNYIANNGFHDEGIALYGYGSQLANTIPAYSLSNGCTSILTSAGAEGSYFVNTDGFTSSGTVFYTVGFNPATTAVYRLSKSGTRFYTTDPAESTNLQTTGFTLEGKTGLDDFAPDLHNLPVYRLAGAKGHFYTADRAERDSAVVNYGYYSEGTGWYAPDETFPRSTPVYRDTNYGTGMRLYTSSIQERNDARTYSGFVDESAGWYSYPNP